MIMARQIEKHLRGIPVLQTFGNHDFYASQAHDIPDHRSRIAFRDWLMGQNRLYGVSCDWFDAYNYSTTIGGIQIVSLQGLEYKDKIYSVGDDALSWLDAVLAKRSHEKQIVFCHYPLTDNTGRIYLRENTRVKQILERHGNILYFAGHTHDSPDSDMPAITSKGSVTYINTASVGNTEPCSKTVRELKPFRDKTVFPQLHEYVCRRSMGLRVEVYDTYYLIRGVDFSKNQYSPHCFVKIPG